MPATVWVRLRSCLHSLTPPMQGYHMANYTTKLVDRTNGSPSRLLQAILRDVQSLFDEALEGAGLQVGVSWGDASETDSYVVHFVEDRTPPNSYLLQTWPHANIDPRAGGHTYRDGVKSGSEVYRFADSGSRSQALVMPSSSCTNCSIISFPT
jgi:hypothetical protein